MSLNQSVRRKFATTNPLSHDEVLYKWSYRFNFTLVILVWSCTKRACKEEEIRLYLSVEPTNTGTSLSRKKKSAMRWGYIAYLSKIGKKFSLGWFLIPN